MPQQQQHAPRVLVVDDEPDICAVMADALEPEGYEVTCFTDPRKAIEHVGRHGAEVALIDLVMPSGEQAGAAVVERAARLGVRVIVMTGALDAADRLQALPPHRHLAKPFRVADLLNLVRGALAAAAA